MNIFTAMEQNKIKKILLIVFSIPLIIGIRFIGMNIGAPMVFIGLIGVIIMCLLISKDAKPESSISKSPSKTSSPRHLLNSKKKLEKFKKILQVSDKVALNRIQSALNMETDAFNEVIFDWAQELKCTIDGEYLCVNKETVDDFINMLDANFEGWANKEKGTRKQKSKF
jgi:hypothetical protein